MSFTEFRGITAVSQTALNTLTLASIWTFMNLFEHEVMIDATELFILICLSDLDLASRSHGCEVVPVIS